MIHNIYKYYYIFICKLDKINNAKDSIETIDWQ